MKIAILGAGALGCYYGARLQESGQDVSFIVRSEYGYLKEHGLQVKSLHGNISLPRINVYRDTEEVGPVDLVVVAWKSTANAGFSRALPTLMGPDTTVVTLQNGMGNAEEIARIIPADRIYVGLCFICAMRAEPGHVNHLEGGNIQFAPFVPSPEGSEKARELLELFANAGIKTRAFDAADKSSGTSLSGTSRSTGCAWRWAASALRNSIKTRKTSPGRAASWRK
ncbi:MAG: ketopantoate reductase family protein [Akkermansia sp.]